MYAQVAIESALDCCQNEYHPVIIFSSGNGIERVPSWAQTLHDNCVIEAVHHNLSFVDRIMNHTSSSRGKSFFDAEAMRMDIPNIIGDVAKKIEKRCGLSNGRSFSVEPFMRVYTHTGNRAIRKKKRSTLPFSSRPWYLLACPSSRKM
jgi:hypothetical protein